MITDLFFAVEIPRILPFNEKTVQPLGSTLVLTCNTLSGSRPLTFEWLRDGLKLSKIVSLQDPGADTSSRYSIEHKYSFSQLTLLDVRPADSGNYSCTVANEAGSSEPAWSVFSVTGNFLICLR